MARRRRPGRADSSETTAAASRRPDVLARLRPWWPLACVLLLLVLLYPEPIFQGKVYGSADAASSGAFRQVGDEARAAGEFPLWNPYIFGGMPTFGSLAYTPWIYPPTAVFETLQGWGAPPLTWMLGHLLFGGLGMWWLLGRWRTPWAARLAACVAWLWFAKVVAWGVHGHGTKLGSAMYLPWLVGLCWDILVRGRLWSVALAAVLLGLQFLRGHPQITYYTLLLLGFLTVWNLVWPLGEGARPAIAARLQRAGMMALVVVLGFAVGSALLLPVQDYAALSTRGAGGASGGAGTAFDYATQWSLAPEDLAAVVVPTAAGFGKATYLGRMPFNDYPNYLGPLLLLLAAAAWFSGRRSLVTALGAGAVVAVLVGMGRFSPGLFQFCYEVLPYFDKFRVPSMIMVLPAVAVAVLAGLGLTALADPERVSPVTLRRAALLVLGLGLAWLLVAITGLSQGAYQQGLTDLAARSGKQAAAVILDAATELHRALLVRQALVLLAAGGALLLAVRRPAFRSAWLVPVLAVILIIDVGSVARLVTHPERALREVVRTTDGGGRLDRAGRLVHAWQGNAPVQVDPTLAAVLQEAVGHGRLLPLGRDSGSNAYMTADVRSLGGYHPAKPAAGEAVRQRVFAQQPAGHVARWLATAAVTYPAELGPGNLDMLRERGLALEAPGRPAGGTRVYRVERPVPRARLVDSWQRADLLPEGDALEPFLDAIAAGIHDPLAVTVLAQDPVPLPEKGTASLPTPEFVVDGLNEVVLAVETPRPALLLLADLWAPGWQATVDGEPAPVLRADLMLRAVALPAGAHEVCFVYRDPARQRGRILAGAGVLGIIILLAVAWRRERATVAKTIES